MRDHIYRNLPLLILLVFSINSAAANQITFNNSRVQGHIVDNCKSWATNCDGGGAQLFCRSKGYRDAVSWKHNRPGTTFGMGSKQVCRGNFCVGYSSITCQDDKVPTPEFDFSTTHVDRPLNEN